MTALNSSWSGTVAALALVVATLWAQTLALYVASNSHCVSACDAGNATYADDLVCTDSHYRTASKGVAMKKCLLCESTSTTYSNATDNDVFWFLFNQKYTVQHCLYEESPDESLAFCEPECLPLQPVFKTVWYPDEDDPKSPLYDYCTANDGAFEKYWKKCRTCMRAKKGSVVLGNFISNMGVACETKPNAEGGETLNIKQPIFSSSITSTASATSLPTAMDKSSKPSATSTSSSVAPDSSESSDSSKSEDLSDSSRSSGTPGTSGLSAGASAGIGVGVAVGVIIVALAIWFFLRRSRQKRQEEIATLSPVHDIYRDPKSFPQELQYHQVPAVNEAGGTPRSELPT